MLNRWSCLNAGLFPPCLKSCMHFSWADQHWYMMQALWSAILHCHHYCHCGGMDSQLCEYCLDCCLTLPFQLVFQLLFWFCWNGIMSPFLRVLLLTPCDVISLKCRNAINIVAYATLLSMHIYKCASCIWIYICYCYTLTHTHVHIYIHIYVHIYIYWRTCLGHGLCLWLVLTLLVSPSCMCSRYTLCVHSSYYKSTIITA